MYTTNHNVKTFYNDENMLEALLNEQGNIPIFVLNMCVYNKHDDIEILD